MMDRIEIQLKELCSLQDDVTMLSTIIRGCRTIPLRDHYVGEQGFKIKRCDDLLHQIADDWRAMYEALGRAVQLAAIANDWDLGTDGEVEIDGEWVSCWELRKEFATALARARGDPDA